MSMRLNAAAVGLMALVCLSVGAAAQGPASASASAASSSGKIGIINIQQAIQGSQEGKKAVADLNTEFKPKQTDLQNQSKEIQSLQQKLQDGGNTLSADAKAELTRTIESKQKDLQRAYEDAQSDYQNATNDAINRIGTKMMQIINAYAQEHGFTLILDVSSPQTPVLYASEAINITPDIIKLYDQKYPVAAAATKPAPTKP